MAPFSVGIIPDGNRRYAKVNSISVESAYLKGFEKIGDVVRWASETEVNSITFWAMSLENFTKRSPAELEIVFRIMSKFMDDLLASPRLDEEKVRMTFFGNLQLLPNYILERLKKLEEKTAQNGGRTVNLAVAYSGKDELVQAARKLAEEYKAGGIGKIDEAAFEQRLQYRKPVDLVIRTGNVKRMSGFLPWQTDYAEYYFSEKMWPAFEREDFLAAVDYFKNAERRFGK